jgi:hypothetical protein
VAANRIAQPTDFAELIAIDGGFVEQNKNKSLRFDAGRGIVR